MDEQKPALLEVAIAPLPTLLSYAQPADFPVSVGSRVLVPLGKRAAHGVVIRKKPLEPTTERTYTVREIHISEEPIPVIQENQIPLFEWIADYYGETLSNVIEICLPQIAHRTPKEVLSLADGVEIPALRGGKQRSIAQLLLDSNGMLPADEVRRRIPSASQAIRALKEKGVIESTFAEVPPSYLTTKPPEYLHKVVSSLTDHQKRAESEIKAAIEETRFQTFLLHGVTGSGKTEVYISTIRAVRERGLGAIVIVPEIALTPQLVDRFRVHFRDEIAILHSAVEKRERWEMWQGILKGDLPIVIGARSAIFAPVPHLGIVVVDEEHDSSFKQAERFRYNGRDLAIVRGQMSSCPVILGSATPSLESFYNAAQKRYRYLPLPQRAGTAPESAITVVNLNQVKRKDMVSKNLSPTLYEGIKSAVARGEQVFVLYNRRGFASYLQCVICQTTIECPNCSVTLTYHRGKDSLLCHYCGVRITPPRYCPQCSSQSAISDTPPELKLFGGGTERVYDELKELFPTITLERLDRDTAQDLEAYRGILGRLRREETQILVGTQMIAKGHDLPSVTLVGVVDCDVGLHMPDFRSSERIFQLLTQVAGRAGRANLAGHTILQTRSPAHPSVLWTKERDYLSFAKQELASRKSLLYPPFARILRIVASSPVPELCEMTLIELKKLAEQLIENNAFPVVILGPTQAPIEKLKTKFRWHMLLKCQKPSHASHLTRLLKAAQIGSNRVTVTFDLDPQDML